MSVSRESDLKEENFTLRKSVIAIEQDVKDLHLMTFHYDEIDDDDEGELWDPAKEEEEEVKPPVSLPRKGTSVFSILKKERQQHPEDVHNFSDPSSVPEDPSSVPEDPPSGHVKFEEGLPSSTEQQKGPSKKGPRRSSLFRQNSRVVRDQVNKIRKKQGIAPRDHDVV